MTSIAVVIPSLNPDERLTGVVQGLLAVGFKDIVLVDDGSAPENKRIFRSLETLPQVTVLEHPENRGKGRALKTAFAYLTEHRPDIRGAVTADGDGQHVAADVLRVAQALEEDAGGMVLGVRDFDAPQVPPRSRIGNKISRVTMRLLCGLRVTDTQTGLRGVPATLFPALLAVAGDRFEYETRVLLDLNRLGVPFRELVIETVYEGNNEVSHFRPLRDGLRVYGLMWDYFLRFVGSSLACFAVDIGLFWLLGRFAFGELPEHRQILFSTVVARILSSGLNFSLNRYAVFGSHRRLGGQLWRYAALCVALMLCSAGLVMLLCRFLPLPQSLLKCGVDTFLFLLSYQIQRRYIFKGTTP